MAIRELSSLGRFTSRTLANLSITGHLRCFSDQPVAEIVQCGEPFCGYLIWGLLLASYFKNNAIEYAGLSNLPTPNLILLFLSNLVLAFLLAFVFGQWASIGTFAGGLAAGAIIGFLIHLSGKLSMMGYMNLYKEITPVVVDILVESARASLAGGVIGAVLGLMR